MLIETEVAGLGLAPNQRPQSVAHLRRLEDRAARLAARGARHVATLKSRLLAAQHRAGLSGLGLSFKDDWWKFGAGAAAGVVGTILAPKIGSGLSTVGTGLKTAATNVWQLLSTPSVLKAPTTQAPAGGGQAIPGGGQAIPGGGGAVPGGGYAYSTFPVPGGASAQAEPAARGGRSGGGGGIMAGLPSWALPAAAVAGVALLLVMRGGAKK